MHVAVLKETFPGERRVALVPAVVPFLSKAGIHVQIQAGAGVEAGFPDAAYTARGAEVVAGRAELLKRADVIGQVRALGANPDAGRGDLVELRDGQAVVGMCDPLGNPQAIQELAGCGATLFALELMPRITRAQSMDVLSSMATIAGYKAVLLAANHLPKMFAMMMTAAGTLTAAKVFVIGAGVAGLQAIATAKRLGAIVEAYDVRPAAMEQIASLGGKPVTLDLDTGDSEDAGGYAKQLTEDQQIRQREMLADVIAGHDVCISTAAIPGKPSPLLVIEDAVKRMTPGGVVVDLAAERGGNCALSKPDETVIAHGITILGPTNLASEVPGHASQMYAKNVATFLIHLAQDGRLHLNLEDEITRDTMVAHGGHVTSERIREMLGLGPIEEEETAASDADDENDEYQLEEPR